MAKVRNRSQTVTIDVYFSFSFAVVLDFNQFPVPPSEAKSTGDVLMNRQNAEIRSMFFCLL
jgi:hypothetical protein